MPPISADVADGADEADELPVVKTGATSRCSGMCEPPR